MIRTKNEQAVEFKCIRNGNGETEMRKILNGEEELYGKGRLFNHTLTFQSDLTTVGVSGFQLPVLRHSA